MSYKVELRQPLASRIVRWGLPDAVLVEVYIRLRQDMAENPSRVLLRTRSPFDGMTYHFTVVDPENRFCEHLFLFHVVYGQDEERLIVANGMYVKSSI